MDYEKLAKEFIVVSHNFRKLNMQKDFDENMKGEMFVIFYVLYKKDDVTPTLIRESLNVSSARVAAILNSLEKKNLISRKQSEKDKRKVLVELTAAGIELAEETKNNVISDVTNMLMLLGENDALEFVRIMKKLSTLL